MSDDEFYARLEPFSEFERFADFEEYSPLPSDWVVLAGDIEGSTQAIAEGRYKDVNMVGAAVITAVLNVCGKIEVPFVFGGDGGAVVVPAGLAEDGAAALRRLQAHAKDTFGLSLRAAMVPVSRIRHAGQELRVRRMLLNGRNHLAMFAGGGMDLVERVLKTYSADDPAILRPKPGDDAPDLQGLSCRWEPLSASRGRMIALMVRPVVHGDPGPAYGEILGRLQEILDQDIPAHAPASDQSLRFRWPPRGLRMEARMLAPTLGWLKAWSWTIFTSAVTKWCEWRGGRFGPFDAPRYLEELKAQTDFRKFDDCLRTVLDCSAEQVSEIKNYLDQAHEKGLLAYGLHADRSALMTCLVFSISQGEHLHFVDAAGGGFAKAAKGFKQRLAALGAE